MRASTALYAVVLACVAAACRGLDDSKCSPPEPLIILFNHVPKAAGITLEWIMKELAPVNNFTLHPWPAVEDRLKHDYLRGVLLDAIKRRERLVITSHFLFPDDFADHPDIAFLNTVREPAERCVSFYYFVRYGDLMPEDWRQKNLKMFGDMSLEDCLDGRMPVPPPPLDCAMCQPSQAKYFCGREMGPCQKMSDDEQAENALHNIENHYGAVGISEQMDRTVELFEVMYPSFFRGARSTMLRIGPANVNQHKPYTSPETLAKYRKRLTADVRLYDKVKRDFEEMYRKCVEHEL